MINNKRIVGVIPARAGSKGIPNKNMALLKNKPLIYWTIMAAKKSRYLDEVIVSTDDPIIQNYAKEHDCKADFLRPAALSTDQASSVDVVRDVLGREDGFCYLVLLQPTSPLRRSEDIDACVQLSVTKELQSLVSITKSNEHPFLAYERGEFGDLKPFVSRGSGVSLRRQDLPSSFRINGAIYCVNVDWFKENKALISDNSHGYVMPAHNSLDIDTLEDLARAESIFG